MFEIRVEACETRLTFFFESTAAVLGARVDDLRTPLLTTPYAHPPAPPTRDERDDFPVSEFLYALYRDLLSEVERTGLRSPDTHK